MMKFWFTRKSLNESETEEFDMIDNCSEKESRKGGEPKNEFESGFRPRIHTYTNYLHTLMLDSFPEYKEKYGSCYQQWKMKTMDFVNITRNEAIDVWNGLKQQNINELLQTNSETRNGYYTENGL